MQFAPEGVDSYRARYVGSSSRTQVSSHPIVPTFVLATARLTVIRTRRILPSCTAFDNLRIASFVEATAGLSIMNYQPTISTAIKTLLVLDDEEHGHTECLPTVNQDTPTAEVPNSDTRHQLFE